MLQKTTIVAEGKDNCHVINGLFTMDRPPGLTMAAIDGLGHEKYDVLNECMLLCRKEMLWSVR